MSEIALTILALIMAGLIFTAVTQESEARDRCDKMGLVVTQYNDRLYCVERGNLK